LLESLRPDVYVKGREYERIQDPRFLAERDTVVRHGGRVVLSSGEVVYSSTALIGAMSGRDLFNDEKVARLRDRYELSAIHLQNLLQRARGLKVLVVGDYILDRYHFCDANRVAGKGRCSRSARCRIATTTAARRDRPAPAARSAADAHQRAGG